MNTDNADLKKEQDVTSSTCGPIAAIAASHHHHATAGHPCLPVVQCPQADLPPQLPMPWGGPCLRTHQLQHGLARDSKGHVIMMAPVCEKEERDKNLEEAVEVFKNIFMKKKDGNTEENDEKEGEKMENEDGGHKKRKFEDQDI